MHSSLYSVQVISVQSLFVTPWTAAPRLPCPSLTPRACSDSCPLSQWCHPTISSSVIPFSSCLQSFPASGSFPMSQFFTSGSQSIGVTALASVLPMNIQFWFPTGLTGLISLQFKGLSRVFSNITVQKHQFFGAQLSLQSILHPYMTTGKTIALTRWTFVGKVMSLFFNTLSGFVSSFSSNEQVSFNFMSAVTIHREFGAQWNIVCHCFHCVPIYLPWSVGFRCFDLSFWMLNFKITFSLSSYTFIKRFFSSPLSLP